MQSVERVYDEKKGRANRDEYLRRKYGIGLDDWEALFDQQGKVCAVCGSDRPGPGDARWHTDHDHDTDEIRGITCSNCNRGIGALGDTVEAVQRAVDYLMNPPGRGMVTSRQQLQLAENARKNEARRQAYREAGLPEPADKW